MLTLLHWLTQLVVRLATSFEPVFLRLTQPSRHSMVLSTVADLTRNKADLVAENALLRQQLIILYRQVNQPRFTPSELFWLIVLASRVRPWKDALLILNPTPSYAGIT